MGAEAQGTLAPLKRLIALAAAGARGADVGAMPVDWTTVLPLAAEHGVLPLVACALMHAPELPCPEDVRVELLAGMRAECAANLVRRQRIIRLLAEMKAEGIEAKLLKGYAVAGCYAHPECRSCVDADILVERHQEKAALRFFEARGFEVSERAMTSQHAVCRHKKVGVVELHVALYAELIEKNWFQGMGVAELVQEPSLTITEEAGSFSTLGATDQLIFLTLHMVKHFILEGLTVRMMLDIALFFLKYREVLDVERYWRILTQLHVADLAGSVLWNMIRLGGLDENAFPGIPQEKAACCAALLEDLVQGGYMGNRELQERYDSGMEYNRLLMCSRRGRLRYKGYMLLWKAKGAANSMFPSRKLLQRQYPLAARHAILRPFLRLWQLGTYPVKKVASGVLKREIRSADSAQSGTVRRRIDLFQQLGMLPPQK